MTQAHNLYRLQQIDLSLDETLHRIEEIEKRLRDRSEIESAARNLEAAETDLRSHHAELKSAEHALASQRSKIQRTEKRLYSGEVSNPKELQDLQQESESLKRYQSTLEDRLLEAMLEHEEAELARDEAKEALDLIKDQREEEDLALRREGEELQREVERLEAEREAALQAVPEADLRRYRELRAKLGPHAVVKIEAGTCSACGLELSGAVLQAARAGAALVQCSQCKRILYPG